MNSKHIVNGLAILGAIVVMIGVSFAARTALAEEPAAVEATAVAIHRAADVSLAAAAEAHEEAANHAAAEIVRSHRLDLDIRFLDASSVTVADNR